VLTATLPSDIAKEIAKALDIECLIVGEGPLDKDEGLELRNGNRKATVRRLKLSSAGRGEEKRLSVAGLDDLLVDDRPGRPRIYFANTVERLQATYDRLCKRIDSKQIIVLHNRMPRRMRNAAERQVATVFGKGGSGGDSLLLTNQVAEAGLDISAPVVVSDPAPVDTLVQRAGRCARWFRDAKTEGNFHVISVPETDLQEWAAPYREYKNALVSIALKEIPEGRVLSWDEERSWVDMAWGVTKPGKTSARLDQLEAALARTSFALNLFDRAAQNRSPGEIAGAFREILSAEIAVEDWNKGRELQELLDSGERPETSSVSLGRAWGLVRKGGRQTKAIRYIDGDLSLEAAEHARPGDVLVVPSTLAYIHDVKGLCFLNQGDAAPPAQGVERSSRWERDAVFARTLTRTGGRRQSLWEHARGVMDGTRRKLTEAGCYRSALLSVLRSLEGRGDDQHIERLATSVAAIATVAAGLHDLGKTDREWQDRARRIDPGSAPGLIGRTEMTAHRIGKPHAHVAFQGTLKACEILIGLPDGAVQHLIAAIALAAARHHSALLNPSTVSAAFEPHTDAAQFVRRVLDHVGAGGAEKDHVQEILQAARSTVRADVVPLLLPNEDLFPVYALVGRAILAADREDASQTALEIWQDATP
jgi:CRISPR-associated endonuclease/helicase Cas3